VLLNCGEDAATLLPQVLARSRGARRAPQPLDLRTYGIGAQILRDLGVGRMKLLGSPRRMPSLLGYGLEVSGYLADEPVVAAPAAAHAQR
jgi:3,4-dihydroxy 2-butanone 4-phosphate synthase/GTP cyclohydrolase II